MVSGLRGRGAWTLALHIAMSSRDQQRVPLLAIPFYYPQNLGSPKVNLLS